MVRASCDYWSYPNIWYFAKRVISTYASNIARNCKFRSSSNACTDDCVHSCSDVIHPMLIDNRCPDKRDRMEKNNCDNSLRSYLRNNFWRSSVQNIIISKYLTLVFSISLIKKAKSRSNITHIKRGS